MKPELTRLYSLLGLRQDCSLAELQLAYRRRIAQLQPRRPGPDALTAEDAALLRELISLYTAANRFHRRHGRLPGAYPKHARSRHAGTQTATRPPPSTSPERRPGGRSERGLLGLVILLLSLALFTIWALVAVYMADGDLATTDNSRRTSPVAALSGNPAGTSPHRPSATESSGRTRARDS